LSHRVGRKRGEGFGLVVTHYGGQVARAGPAVNRSDGRGCIGRILLALQPAANETSGTLVGEHESSPGDVDRRSRRHRNIGPAQRVVGARAFRVPQLKEGAVAVGGRRSEVDICIHGAGGVVVLLAAQRRDEGVAGSY